MVRFRFVEPFVLMTTAVRDLNSAHPCWRNATIRVMQTVMFIMLATSAWGEAGRFKQIYIGEPIVNLPFRCEGVVSCWGDTSPITSWSRLTRGR